ncbi:CBS domain-containing protein [Streptomyces sp. ME01-24h]|nr:CBS domain-containing protein [Streptomyces sp. ME19-03-3]MDX3352956.1 CBS domain-containing protein [Streptomyces sp. ME01-24h]
MPDPAPALVVDVAEGQGPRVCDDMTVEVALAVMAGARVDHLTVCDGDDQSTGLVTAVRLAALRGSAAYTDRTRLRDVLDGSSSSYGARPGARESGRLPGVLTGDLSGARGSSPSRAEQPGPSKPDLVVRRLLP